MLSLAHLLYHLFQQPTIAEEAQKAITDAIHHVNMDKVFKENYIFFSLLRLDVMEPRSHLQVYNLYKLWPKLKDVIDRESFDMLFSHECQKKNLPAGEYDLDSAFSKAQKEWSVELMVATAEHILQRIEDKTFSKPIAFWHEGLICVDRNVCVKYSDLLYDDYIREMA